MSELTTLITGAGVVTPYNDSTVPAYLLIGTVDTNNPLSAITVTVGGDVVQEVVGQSIISAIMKYMMEGLLGADVKIGLMWKVATGFIGHQTFKLRMTNAGATTPIVYGYSDGGNGVPIMIGQETINANSNIVFDMADPTRSFTALFLDPTNFSKAQVDYVDGHSEELLALELAALFALENQCDADGLLGGVLVIDNQKGRIKKIKLYAVTGELTVTKFKLVTP